MKKSEMAERMRKHFNTEHCDQIAFLAYQIIDFLEQQGMLPPAYEKLVEAHGIVSPSPDIKLFYKMPCREWEPEDKA